MLNRKRSGSSIQNYGSGFSRPDYYGSIGTGTLLERKAFYLTRMTEREKIGLKSTSFAAIESRHIFLKRKKIKVKPPAFTWILKFLKREDN
jgi:hypothetical protein